MPECRIQKIHRSDHGSGNDGCWEENKNGKHKLTKVMDIAEIATMAFIASGMTYNAVKYWRVNRKVHLAREWTVHLILKRTDDMSEECRRAVLLVFEDIWCASTLRRMY